MQLQRALRRGSMAASRLSRSRSFRGLTSHSSRRLRRGLTQALGLQQHGHLRQSLGAAFPTLPVITAVHARPAPPTRTSRSGRPDRPTRKPAVLGGKSLASAQLAAWPRLLRTCRPVARGLALV
nr:putative integron gene cassette protein [uncultured bacterium]